MAHFTYYIEDSEAFADMLVFIEDSRVFADEPGRWHFTSNPAFADVFLFEEKEKGYADFTIYFTETASFVGCQ